MLGRHFSQCLWGAINASRGHGLIVHQAALVGISCVPPSIWFSWCGVAAHAETVTAKTIPPTQAIALFPLPCRVRVHMFLAFQPLVILAKNFQQNSAFVCRRSFYSFRGPPSKDLVQAAMLSRFLCVVGLRSLWLITSRRCGLWARPQRSAGGYRVYTQADIP